MPKRLSIEEKIELLIERPELMHFTRMIDPEGWEREFMAPARKRRRAERDARRQAERDA